MTEVLTRPGITEKIEVSTFDAEGYAPVVDYASWRVAILNYIDELEPQNIDNFQQHSETDEVFVLLSGQCILFVAEDDGEGGVEQIQAIDMQPHKMYNVKRGVYHTHTLSQDAKVLIVENRDTDDSNSPKIMIGEREQSELMRLTWHLWG